MRLWTYRELIEEGYTVENVLIKKADLSMADHGCLTLAIVLNGAGWGCTYGGYCIGHGYLGAHNFTCENGNGLESIMRIMDVVGTSSFKDLEGRYARVACKCSDSVKIIGNIMSDKWFDIDSFFKEKECVFYEE